MRYKATLEYNGSRYAGYQVQPNAITVQEVVEKALSELLRTAIKTVASGRTDTGVHARGQVIHFDADTTIPAGNIPYAISPLLPEDISMLDCISVDNSFHARYSAQRKTYSYSVVLSNISRPLYPFSYIYPYSIDRELLTASSKELIGEHDFRAFMATGSAIQSTVRTIYDINVEWHDNSFILHITGSGFLYNMVRIIVGTLLDIARGRLAKDTISRMLETGDRGIGGHTAPARGLTLEKVYY